MVSNDSSSLSLLEHNPQKWSPDDAEAICRVFKQACASKRVPVDPGIISSLWRYWFLVHGAQPLMEEPNYNMALMLNALALGEFVPPQDSKTFFGSYRRQHARWEQPISPLPLAWGPRACLNRVSGPMLDSAVVDVFLFRDNQQLEEILIVGHPPPGLRQEIFQAAFSCLLRIRSSNQDAINTDMFHILASNNKQRLFDLPGITTLGTQSADTQTAAEALGSLVQSLRYLQQQTELVVIHDVDVSNKQAFDRSLRDYARQASQDQTAIIVSKDPEQSPEIADLITLAPYYQIEKRSSQFWVFFHPDILNTPAFEELLDVFTNHTVERIRLDAQVRRETYEKHAEQLRKEQQRWKQARVLWDEMVLLTEVFNDKTGTTIRLAVPKEVPRAEWMENTVPSLISNYQRWADQMQKIIHDIRTATEQSDAPIRRLATGRFLDAALRGRGDLIEGGNVRRCFDRWASQVAPHLHCQWHIALEAKNLPPETVFNRHTVFHTHFQVDNSNRVVALIMQPLAMVSPAHAIILFDPDRPTLTVYTPGDETQAVKVEAQTKSEELWRAFQQASELGATQAELGAKLHSILLQMPNEILSKLVEYLAPTESASPEPPSRSIRLNEAHNALKNRLRLVNFPSKMTTLLNQRALHSARGLIEETQAPPELEVRLVLWRVLIECIAEGENPTTYIPRLAEHPGESIGQIETLLNQARQLDLDFVTEWSNLLKSNQKLQGAVSLLQRDWARLVEKQHLPLYKLESAIESAKLARELEDASKAITADGESTADVLAKIGHSLADLLLTDLGNVPYSDVVDLLEILAGEETPKD